MFEIIFFLLLLSFILVLQFLKFSITGLFKKNTMFRHIATARDEPLHAEGGGGQKKFMKR